MRSSRDFIKKKENVIMETDIAQCCFDSELCEHNPDLFLSNISIFCDNLPGYKNRSKRIMMGPRAYVVLASLFFLLRHLFSYTVSAFLGVDFVGRKIKPTKEGETSTVFRVWEFTPSRDISWQLFSLAVLILPLGLCTSWLAMVYQRNESIYYRLTRRAIETGPEASYVSHSSPHILVVVVAMFLDLCDMYELAKSVLCLCPKWIPKVKVDTK